MLGLDYLIFFRFPEKQTITKSENGFIKRNIFALELKKKHFEQSAGVELFTIMFPRKIKQR